MVFSLRRAVIFGACVWLSAAGGAETLDPPRDPAKLRLEAAQWRVETFTLENGLEVIVLPDRRAPVVTHMVWYKVGAIDERPGKTGLAHFLEHLLFKGTENYPEGAFDQIIKRHGGSHNAFTTDTTTAYFQRIAREHLELVMALEADRMRGLKLDAKAVDIERDVVLEERLLRVDNNPGARLGALISQALYPDDPAAHEVIGYREDIEGLTLQDARDFYDRWYWPNNAFLVVAGDVDAEELRPLAEQYYGGLPKNPDLPERAFPPLPDAPDTAFVELSDPRVRQPSLSRRYPAPSFSEPGDTDVYALSIGVAALGGGASSYLHRRLVRDEKIAVRVGAWRSLDGLRGGEIGLYGTPAAGVSLDDFEIALDEAVEDFLEEGPEPVTVDRVKGNLIAGGVYARDSQAQMAQIFGDSLVNGSSVADILDWTAGIDAVTAEAAHQALRAVLQEGRAVTGWLTPPPAPEEPSPADGEDA
ncbi:MAG: M16 family metallopeptidase [Maricaulaceae bacterium]